MDRLRALASSLTVTIVVFVVLALPTLRTLYGPVAVLGVYAALALLAGGLTWSTLHRISAWRDRRAERRETEANVRIAVDPSDGRDDPTDIDERVERELEQLREQQ